jgi:hypothetical protein
MTDHAKPTAFQSFAIRRLRQIKPEIHVKPIDYLRTFIKSHKGKWIDGITPRRLKSLKFAPSETEFELHQTFDTQQTDVGELPELTRGGSIVGPVFRAKRGCCSHPSNPSYLTPKRQNHPIY